MRWSAVLALAVWVFPALGAEVGGTLQWARRVELALPLSGVVASVGVEPGQRVKKGQTLLQLDTRPYAAEVARVRAELARLSTLRGEAEKEQQRAQELFDRTLISEHELEVERLDFATAEAQYQAARALVARAELNLEYCTLKAPFDGRVLDVRAEPGMAVATELSSVPLVSLAESGRMVARVAVEEAMLSQMQVGERVALSAAGRRWDGRLHRIGFEPLSGSPALYPVDVLFEVPPGTTLRAGQGAKVMLP